MPEETFQIECYSETLKETGTVALKFNGMSEDEKKRWRRKNDLLFLHNFAT